MFGHSGAQGVCLALSSEITIGRLGVPYGMMETEPCWQHERQMQYPLCSLSGSRKKIDEEIIKNSAEK